MKCKVEILPSGKIYDVESGTSLHDVLKESEIEFPCGGKGTCGKCNVKTFNERRQPENSWNTCYRYCKR